MRLWDYEEGDEIGQHGFIRGEPVIEAEPAAPAAPAAQAEPEAAAPMADPGLRDAILAEGADEDGVLRDDALAWEEILAGGVGDAEANRNEQPERPVALGANNGRVVVAQEGPLVLRLDMGGAPEPRRDRAGPQQQVQEAGAPPAARQQRQRAGGLQRNRANPGIARQQLHQQQQQQQQRIGQRGRGGRGRGTGRRENHNEVPNQGPGLGRRQRQHNQQPADGGGPGQQDELQDVDAAWIRHFIHLALEDNEHLIDD